jgi:hypothetical protein
LAEKLGGLLFSEAEIAEFNLIAQECNFADWSSQTFRQWTAQVLAS